MLRLLTIAALTLIAASGARADAWDDTLARARGQTVYWNAWGGDEQINAYIAWVGEQVAARYSVARRSAGSSPRRRRAATATARST
jgi:putative thiamine transport system substrate-binding protein